MMNKIITLVVIMSLGISLIKAPQPFEALSLEERAALVGLSAEDYELMSDVVEAESNRSTDGDLTGRIYIALVIFNRVEDERFNCDTVREVLTAPGQFSTVRNGRCSCADRTDFSDMAIIQAWEWIQSGEEVPEVYFFNCRGYFSSRTAVGEFGGNYFSGF